MSEPGGLPGQLPVADGEDRWRLVVPLVVALVFLPGVTGGFVYDDIALIRDNPSAHGLGHAVEAFTSSFWETAGSARYYRPLVTLSYLQDWSLGGGSAWAFHLTNVFLHCAASMLALSVATRWTGSRSAGVLVAFLVALHPSRSQSVTWISGRPDVLMTCFALGCVELAHRAAIASRRRRPRLLLMSFISFVGAVLCKESAVLVPLLLCVEALLVEGDGRRWLIRLVQVTGTLAMGYVAVRLFAFPAHPGLGFEFTPRRGFVTVFAYVERVLFPWPQTFFHRPLTVTAGQLDLPAVAVGLGASVCVAFTALLARTWRRDRAAALLLVSSGAALGPLLNFTRTGLAYTTADHLLYLPLFLLFAGAARLALAGITRWAQRRDAKLALAALLLAWGGIVMVRSLDYTDQTTLFESELALLPDNPMALMSLGEEAARRGDVEEAFALSLRALGAPSARYPLLLPAIPRAKTYQRLLGLQAARTADGSPDDLERLLAEMERLLASAPTGVEETVGELKLGRRFDGPTLEAALSGGDRDALTAEAAFVASRLGETATARRLLATLGPEAREHVPSVGNLLLSHARIGDLDGAGKWLAFLEGEVEPERQRLSRVRTLMARAEGAGPLERAALRAQAHLDLGAYLVALRELRPVYGAGRSHPMLGPLFVHLLMAARLEEEASLVATQALGAEGARDLLDRIRSEMPPRLLSLRRPKEPSGWSNGRANH